MSGAAFSSLAWSSSLNFSEKPATVLDLAREVQAWMAGDEAAGQRGSGVPPEASSQEPRVAERTGL